jgi:hypothetical protein
LDWGCSQYRRYQKIFFWRRHEGVRRSNFMTNEIGDEHVSQNAVTVKYGVQTTVLVKQTEEYYTASIIVHTDMFNFK